MKIILMRSAIHDTLSRLARIITTKSTMPVLGHILLKAENGVFSLASTNLEMDARSPVSADIDEPGMFAVPGERLAAIVAALADDARITIDTTDDKLTLKSGRARYNLTTLGADAFPNWAIEGDWIDYFAVRAKDLQRIVSMVAPYADDLRPELMSVYLECNDNNLTAMSGDGKRLISASVEIARGEPIKLLLNLNAAKELVHLLDKIGGDVSVGGCATKLSVKFNNGFVFTTRLLNATFPEQIHNVFDTAERNQQIVIIIGAQFSGMVSRLLAMASESRTAVFLTIEKNNILATIRHPEHGDAEDSVECEYDGEKIIIGFQIKYLRQLLDTINAVTIVLKIRDGTPLTFWQSVDDRSTKFVQMTRVGT